MITHLTAGFPLTLKFAKTHEVLAIPHDLLALLTFKNTHLRLIMYPVGTSAPPQRVFRLSGSELYSTYSQIQRIKTPTGETLG